MFINFAPRAPSRELLILNLFRHQTIFTQAAFFILFINLKVAFKPLHMAVAFIGQNMRGEMVKEHAVMADDDRAACKIVHEIIQ